LDGLQQEVGCFFDGLQPHFFAEGPKILHFVALERDNIFSYLYLQDDMRSRLARRQIPLVAAEPRRIADL
jgi:hypothetical protein